MPASRILYDPSVHAEPSGAPGNDMMSIQSTPAMQGGLVAEGLGKLGAGLEHAGQAGFQTSGFFGQVAADDATNNFQDFSTKLLYGDPSKTVVGPDGKPQVDRGYFGLKGGDALRARPDVEKQLDEQLKQTRTTLSSPDQQLLFDRDTRRFRMLMGERIGSHADREANTYAVGVNSATEKMAMDRIAINADDPDVVAHATEDLVNARVKSAQVAGGGPEVVQEAQASGQKLALKAQLDAVAVKDPARAMRMLEEKKGIAGDIYDNLATAYRSRAEQQNGTNAGQKAFMGTYQKVPAQTNVTPVLQNIGARYGVSGAYLQRTWQVEASGKLNPSDSITGAAGPFQFTKGTARQFGLEDPHDFMQSADAAARLGASNKIMLASSLGREPTDAELYLAHQQGAQGASLLLRNPNTRAGDLVGDKAIRVNGGNPNAPASAFTGMWDSRFNGSIGVMSSARKADAYQQIASDPNLNENERQHAFQYVNHIASAQQIAMEADSARQKQLSDAAEGEYLSKASNPAAVIDPREILGDQRLLPEKRTRLFDFITKISGESQHDKTTYGPQFNDLFRQIHAPEGNPDRITDPSQLEAKVGSGLTFAGYNQLRQEIMGKRTPDGEAESKMKEQFFKNARAQITGTNEGIHLKDPKGDELYLKFMAQAFPAYTKGRSEGKSAAQLLNPDSPDYIGKSISQFRRPMKDWYADMLSASHGEAQPDLATAEGVIAAVQGGKLPLAEGKRIALEKGWIRADAPVVAKPAEPTVPLSR